MTQLLNRCVAMVFLLLFVTQMNAKDTFPDGSPIPQWFRETKNIKLRELGKQYRVTDFGVINDSTKLQTEQLQAVIDQAAEAGGGVVLIPKGVYLTSSLFFKPHTHLYLEEGAVIKGSDDISHFPVMKTRIEGQTLDYFAALINADGVDGFTISGKGTINGNGLRYWKSFWQRRAVNPNCTNIDELRPRLVYISNSKNVQLSGVRLENSPFWTTHLYKCENVKLLGLYIYSPSEPVKAPSTDAVDIDACTNVLIKDCYMSVNDDAIALKGGKGPTANEDSNNGGNNNIIIEDCTFGFCHSALTFGSECLHSRNIVMRRCVIKERAARLLWLKMRPDTPQNYEYVLVEDVKGEARNFLYIRPWTQFFDLKGQEEMPKSYSSHVTMRNINLVCETFFNVDASDQYELNDFSFEGLRIEATKDGTIHKEYIKGLSIKDVVVNDEEIK